MSQNIMAVRIKESGLWALPVELGRRCNLQDGDTLTLISLGGDAFLLVRLPEKRPSLADTQQSFGRAMAEAGYGTRDKIVELVREVKREIAADRDTA
jgi:bifunctional DNA-binding transcriptional regulator/antitoxin component of YhaV-PrlF toxin-antitoxin module